MQKKTVYFVLANVVGILLLIATSAHFGAPLFGWVITGGIIAVFAAGMERYRRVYQHLAVEEDLLEEYRRQATPEPIGEGVIAERIRRVQELTARGIVVDPQVFSEILSARESSTLNRSPGGLVVLLGLAGTFYGLMVAVSGAGNSLDASNTQTTLSAIHDIFSSMKGIFGTSFCGLLAALFLNSTHQLVSGRKMAYMADVEEYTQFQLLTAYTPKGDNAEELRRNALVEQLSKVVSSLETGLQAELGKAISSLSRNLEEATRVSMERLESSQQKASQNLENAVAGALHQVEESGRILVKGMGDSAAELFTRQSESTQKQWQATQESLQFSLHQNLDQGKQSLESLGSMGKQLAEQGETSLRALQDLAQRLSSQADDHSMSLTHNVGDQIGQLSNAVQASFTQLAESSATLVESQRALIQEVGGRMDREKELAEQLQAGVGEAGTLMRINQSEFQASLEMFRQGTESLLEKFHGNSAEQEGQQAFIEQLHATLEAFSEKASEVLVENAMRTQEILLEVLEQTRSRQMPSGSENA